MPEIDVCFQCSDNAVVDDLQENLRQLCIYKLANESHVPWKWWEYVTKFGEQCKMSENQYNEECAERVSGLSQLELCLSFCQALT